jgi:hypothetical protein
MRFEHWALIIQTDALRRLPAKKGAKHDGETVEKAISLGFPALNLRPTPLTRGQGIELRRPRPSPEVAVGLTQTASHVFPKNADCTDHFLSPLRGAIMALEVATKRQ